MTFDRVQLVGSCIRSSHKPGPMSHDLGRQAQLVMERVPQLATEVLKADMSAAKRLNHAQEKASLRLMSWRFGRISLALEHIGRSHLRTESVARDTG